MKPSISFILFITFVHVIFGAPVEDEIKSLPGLCCDITFKHYSGYLNGSTGDHMHYWFVESQNNPSTDPVVLWLNGGPGCSSMDGLLNELGPYLISEDGKKLRLNDYSWNKIANVLFIESPACVGFSYRDSGDCVSSDDTVSLSNYEALKSFFKKFPEYKKNPLFITGESYGGIYIPTLTERILDGMRYTALNLQGFAIGNGLTSYELNDKSLIFFAYYHGLIGEDLWDSLVSNCCKDGMASYRKCFFTATVWPKCQAQVKIVESILYNKDLNIYNLYAKCLHPNTTTTPASQSPRYLIDKHNLFLSDLTHKTAAKRLMRLKLDPPCTYSGNMRAFFNDEVVRRAVHIPTSFKKKWDICNDEVVSFYNRTYMSMYPQYIKLTEKVRGLVYNGDVDMACNFLGDEWFTESLDLPLVSPRKMWYYQDQIGGFVKRFKNLDVVTVRGSGHMVPQDKPGPAFKMISSFIYNKDY